MPSSLGSLPSKQQGSALCNEAIPPFIKAQNVIYRRTSPLLTAAIYYLFNNAFNCRDRNLLVSSHCIYYPDFVANFGIPSGQHQKAKGFNFSTAVNASSQDSFAPTMSIGTTAASVLDFAQHQVDRLMPPNSREKAYVRTKEFATARPMLFVCSVNPPLMKTEFDK